MKNGFEWLRIVTPVLVTIALFWMGHIQSDLDYLGRIVKTNDEIITKNLYSEFSEIKQRLTAVETQLRMMNHNNKIAKEESKDENISDSAVGVVSVHRDGKRSSN